MVWIAWHKMAQHLRIFLYTQCSKPSLSFFPHSPHFSYTSLDPKVVWWFSMVFPFPFNRIHEGHLSPGILRQKEMVFVNFTRMGSPPMSRSPKRKSASNSRQRKPWILASWDAAGGFHTVNSVNQCILFPKNGISVYIYIQLIISISDNTLTSCRIFVVWSEKMHSGIWLVGEFPPFPFW